MTAQGVWRVGQAAGEGARASRQRPYWLTGLVLLVIVVAVIGAAFLLDRRFRPPVSIEPASGTAQQAAGVPSKTISSEADIGQLSSPLQREVASAYLRYWAVYATAMETLDASRLPDVADGNRLQEARADVDDLRAEGVAAQFQIRHNFSVTQASQNEATVRDEYVNTSFAVDPQSRQPVGEPGSSQQTKNTYYLRRINQVWKVADAKKGWD